MTVPFEEYDSKVRFELAYSAADAGLRQVELLGGSREVSVPERRLEGNECGKRWKQPIESCHLITECQVA